MNKLKFKRHRQKWYSDYYYIIVGKHEIGQFRDESPFTIMLKVTNEPTLSSSAPFKWATLKNTFDSLEDCQNFVIKNIDQIVKNFDLYLK